MILSIIISIFNIASVYFAAKNNRLTWLFGIFAALLTLMLVMPWMLELYITNVQDVFVQKS